MQDGDKIIFSDWSKGSALAGVICLAIYTNDQVVVGSTSRVNYKQLSSIDYENGNYEYVVPSNCGLVGLSYQYVTYPIGENALVKIGEDILILTDKGKEIIENAGIGRGGSKDDESAKYYLKGNSNIVSSGKKIGIIAAGQSNMDGRCAFADLPSDFVNNNEKVQMIGSTEKYNHSAGFSAFGISESASLLD